MVISMTGFGRSKTESAVFSVNVEVKTVNHRFCEINIRMPRQFLKIEDKIKKKINSISAVAGLRSLHNCKVKVQSHAKSTLIGN